MSSNPTVLCADDFALTEGVTRGIEELAAVRRLSAASAIVTTPHWPVHGPRLAALRDRIVVGLHLNLTLGAPLGPLPSLAPGGILPSIGVLIGRSLTGRLDRAEIISEFARQFNAFEKWVGRPPDFVDGHQHVHAMATVRDALIETLVARGQSPPPLVRDPADRPARIAQRGLYVAKSLVLYRLARGMKSLIEANGLPSNDSFSGISAFDRNRRYSEELDRAMRARGRLHLVMCHPGHPDAELAAIDPVVDRRNDELEALMADPDLATRIWHPARPVDGPPIDWRSL